MIVGIPALAFYNYFVSSIKKLVGDIETVANDVVDTIQDSSSEVENVEDEIEVEI